MYSTCFQFVLFTHVLMYMSNCTYTYTCTSTCIFLYNDTETVPVTFTYSTCIIISFRKKHKRQLTDCVTPLAA